MNSQSRVDTGANHLSLMMEFADDAPDPRALVSFTGETALASTPSSKK